MRTIEHGGTTYKVLEPPYELGRDGRVTKGKDSRAIAGPWVDPGRAAVWEKSAKPKAPARRRKKG